MADGTATNGAADPVNLSFVGPDGSALPLTDYQASAHNVGGVRLAVTNLRPGSSGRVYATLEQLQRTVRGTTVRSTELVIDPKTRTISATATGPGQLVFDDDAVGNALVGEQRDGAVTWRHQDGTPIAAPGCELATTANQ